VVKKRGIQSTSKAWQRASNLALVGIVSFAGIEQECSLRALLHGLSARNHTAWQRGSGIGKYSSNVAHTFATLNFILAENISTQPIAPPNSNGTQKS
jgi:hypothetical protein